MTVSNDTKTITQVPLLDLQIQYEPIKEDILKAIKEVFESKRFIMGPKITQLEEEIAKYCHCKHAIGVSSGTDALVISLMALGIGPGDEVITTPFTFFATAGSISRVGATPVFVDIDPETYNISPDLIEQKITSKTKAIMPVHLFGQMADMDKIMALAKKHELSVIEDAAQAIGCNYKSASDSQVKWAGSVGDVGCFSFFPSKNLGCCGDGGIVTTNDDVLAEKLRILRVHGSKPKYYHHVIGGNFRLDPLQAAVLLVKLPYLEEQHQKRQANASFYTQQLKDQVKTPFIKEGYRMIYNQYVIRSENREEIQEALNNNKVGNAVYYPVPLHLQPCFKYLGYSNGDCPESEKAAAEVVAIPIYAELTDEQKGYVVEVVKAVF
ncbi:DegT/DnrJ/EryC1/StrS family aminotransferase [Candidatus Margulisiibacteriota bacterium]